MDKLLRHGEGWLTGHPERDTIVKRYLKHRRSLAAQVIAQLVDAPKPEEAEQRHGGEEAAIEDRISLNQQRLDAAASTCCSPCAGTLQEKSRSIL